MDTMLRALMKRGRRKRVWLSRHYVVPAAFWSGSAGFSP